MTKSTFILPMETIVKHTVSVSGWSASCMNCGESFAGGNAVCHGCGTVFVFAASEKVGPGVIDQMRNYANAHGLELIGYSDGGCLEMGGGSVFSFDTYPSL